VNKGCRCHPDPARSLLGLFVVGLQRAGLFPLVLEAAAENGVKGSQWVGGKTLAEPKWAGSVGELVRHLKLIWDVDQTLDHVTGCFPGCRDRGFERYREELQILERNMAIWDIKEVIRHIFDYEQSLATRAQTTGILC
jgi:hypothetical protein